MSVKNISALILLTFIIFAGCSKDGGTGPGDQEPAKNYFPNSNGSGFTYSIQFTDSAGAVFSGTRISTFSGTTAIGGVTYQNQIDSLNISGFDTTSVSYFRKTNAGVYFFLDTTGLSSTIPDSLLQYITIDPELIVFSFPLTNGKTWPVFKMVLNYLITLTLVEVRAEYMGMEELSLQLSTGTVNKQAAKIQYTLKLNVPDPNNIFQINTSTFTAFAWLIEDTGVGRWQGNATILNAFSGGGIDFDDTTSVITQSLIGYEIK